MDIHFYKTLSLKVNKMIIYEIYIWWNYEENRKPKKKLAYKYASKDMADINRVIKNLAPTFTWSGKMLNKY